MKQTKILSIVVALLLLAATPMIALAETYGSSAVNAGETYTVEQMLTNAIQDEYMAQAEYAAIIAQYGSDAPFSNIVRAEDTHIALLKQLFETYGLTLPANTAASRVSVPANLADAYAVGITAESVNIAMYDVFLAQANVPKDVSDTFMVLKNASNNHLAAFTQNSEKNGTGMCNGQSDNGKGRNAKNGSTAQGNRSEDCPLKDNCPATGTQRGNQNCRGCSAQNN